jgi:predicted DCC family thiol-disulfide oxidoreductase YuxK
VAERTGLTTAQTDAAAWAIAGDVRVGGARAIALVLAVASSSRIPMLPFRVPGAGWILDRVYEWIAAHRSRLPGDTPWCQAHPQECSGRSVDR